jgi:RNA polymerase II elongation factor ELL
MMKLKFKISLIRRKPQNLTPPLSSDGGSSSTSGQSPNSQHNGSPPPAVKRPSSQAPSSLNNNINSNNLINDNYLEPAAKKKRISLYKKQEMEAMRPSNGYDGRDMGSFIPRTRDDDYYG